jgi:hypothetical protein
MFGLPFEKNVLSFNFECGMGIQGMECTANAKLLLAFPSMMFRNEWPRTAIATKQAPLSFKTSAPFSWLRRSGMRCTLCYRASDLVPAQKLRETFIKYRH